MKRKFPSYIQHESMDCGPACLSMITAFYGIKWPLQSIKDKCHISRQGISLLNLSSVAQSIGFNTEGVRLSFSELYNSTSLPCIAHWDQHHFVVLYKIKKGRKGEYCVYISDPAVGLIKYSMDEFMQHWSYSNVEHESKENKGVVLLIKPTENAYKFPKENSVHNDINYLWKVLRNYKGYALKLLLTLLVGSIISLVLPFSTQLIIDKGIGEANLNFVFLVLLAQLILIVGQTANELIRSWLALNMSSRVNISLVSGFIDKLMRLPVSYFDYRTTGDIIQRIGDYNRVQSFITSSLLGIAIAIVSFLVYSFIMGGYDLWILLTFFIGSGLYIGWIALFMNKRKRIDYMRFKEMSSNQNHLIQLIDGIKEIKLNRCELKKQREWSKIQGRLLDINLKGLKLGQTQQIGGAFIDQTKSLLISFLAVRAVINGDMTLGMMTAMQYVIGQLNAPIQQLVKFIQEAQDAKISLDRLDDVMLKRDEVIAGSGKEIPENASIEFRNVSFSYNGPETESILKDINITIPHNKITAIVGSSGSGKTTLIKLLLGFYDVCSGDILIGGINIKECNLSKWRSLCSTVLQDGFIFSDTIANNVSLSDEQPDMGRVKYSVNIANIYDYIKDLPLECETKIGGDGTNMSYGQKQRLLIARAAYKNSRFVILDEATNSLDTVNESVIMKNLYSFFKNKTVVVVAHRLSTVINADNIIVLNDGRVVEQGVHSQLVANKGYYYELIRNQLELGE